METVCAKERIRSEGDIERLETGQLRECVSPGGRREGVQNAG